LQLIPLEKDNARDMRATSDLTAEAANYPGTHPHDWSTMTYTTKMSKTV
tara:strand:- start:226 stop:372 length:147 start_codon:yes stop_codon:yes gene_type:complete